MGIIRNFKRNWTFLRTEGLAKLLAKVERKAGKYFVKNPAVFSLLLPFMERKIRAVCYDGRNKDHLFDFASNFYYGVIKPGQEREELLPLLDLLEAERAKVVLEIGSENGGNLFHFLKTLPDDATVVSVDLPVSDGGYGYSAMQSRLLYSFARKSQTLHLIKANSGEESTVELVKGVLNGGQLDFLLIDGDHAYDSVKKDFNLYSGLVKEGGVIAFHDISPSPDKGIQVDRFWREIKNNHSSREIIAKNSIMGIGVLLNWKPGPSR